MSSLKALDNSTQALLNPGSSFRLSNSSSLLLDLLRGLGAQAVVIGHALNFFGISPSTTFVQNTGVVMFFILSGIVIPYSTFSKIVKSSSYSFSSYFIDRFSRIYTGLVPALLFVLAADTLKGAVFGSRHVSALDIQTFLGNLLMLQDFPFQSYIIDFVTSRFPGSSFGFLPITSYGSARPLWVVAILWGIYLLFGWIVLGKVHREKHPVIWWFVLALLLIVPGYNWIDGRGNGLSMMWSMGLLIYVMLSRFRVNLSNSYLCILAGVFLFAAFPRLYLTREAYDVLYVGMLALALYFALCFLQRLEIAPPKFISAIIVFNAGFSFTLFLIHYTLLIIFLMWRGIGVSNFLMSVVLCNIVAIALYFPFERNDDVVRRWLKKSFRVTA